MLGSKTSKHRGQTISLLWLFAILNILFRDIHELTMANNIREILSGHVNGNPMSEEVLLAGAFAVELLLLGFLLSSLLDARVARWLNLLLAPLTIAGIFVGAPNDPDDYFFAAVAISTFGAIFVLSWTWVPASASGPVPGGDYAA